MLVLAWCTCILIRVTKVIILLPTFLYCVHCLHSLLSRMHVCNSLCTRFFNSLMIYVICNADYRSATYASSWLGYRSAWIVWQLRLRRLVKDHDPSPWWYFRSYCIRMVTAPMPVILRWHWAAEIWLRHLFRCGIQPDMAKIGKFFSWKMSNERFSDS